jgi:hypothetical protein
MKMGIVPTLRVKWAVVNKPPSTVNSSIISDNIKCIFSWTEGFTPFG